MGRVVVLLLCLFCSARAYALEKPPGGVEVFLPDYGLTVAVAAISIGGLGEGLAVLEKKPDGSWSVCFQCLPAPSGNLANEVARQGGLLQYIEYQRPFINDVFKQRYPEIGTTPNQPPPATAPFQQQLNYALSQNYKLDGSGLSPK